MGVFACAFCGTNQRVVTKGGTVSLQPVEQAIKEVQRGTDRTAAELAIPRLQAELKANELARKAALQQPFDIGEKKDKLDLTVATSSAAVAFLCFIALFFVTSGTAEVVLYFVLAVSILVGIATAYRYHTTFDAGQRERLRAHRDKINAEFAGKAAHIERQLSVCRSVLEADIKRL